MMEDGLTEDDDFDIFEALGVSKTKSTETKFFFLLVILRAKTHART